MKWIEILETRKDINWAYIALVNNDPYYAFNWSVKLDWVERLYGQKIEDGFHKDINIEIEKIPDEADYDEKDYRE